MGAAPPGQVIITVGTVVLTCNYDPNTLAYTNITIVNSGPATTLTVTLLATDAQHVFTIKTNATTTVTAAQLNNAGIVLVSDAAVSI